MYVRFEVFTATSISLLSSGMGCHLPYLREYEGPSPPPHTIILSFQENACAEVVLMLYAIIKQSPHFSYDDEGDDKKNSCHVQVNKSISFDRYQYFGRTHCSSP